MRKNRGGLDQARDNNTHGRRLEPTRVLSPRGGPAGYVDATEKTELREVSAPLEREGGKGGFPQSAVTVVSKIARAAALEMLKDEIELYKGLIHDAETTDEKTALIRQLAELKLNAAGMVLAGMRGQFGGRKKGVKS